jgi:acetylornithine/N-succinyldiaminopimelate aminotransferase
MSDIPIFRSASPIREIVKAQGAEAWDKAGKRYIDMHNGIAVNTVGSCNPEVVEAVHAQSQQVIHTAATFETPIQLEASRKLTATFATKSEMIWVNSGAEANENMVMAARAYHYHAGHSERTVITAFEGCFHGRTLAMRALQGKFMEGIGVEREAFGYSRKAKFNDIDSVRAVIDERAAAIIVEPVQGEGGIIPAKPEFLKALRQLCDEKGILLCFDEVQCGAGRTGKMWAHQHYEVLPDIMSAAKGLGGGYPVGAVFLTQKVADQLRTKVEGKTAFSVGSTFGGNSAMLAAAGKVAELLTTRSDYMGKDAKERSVLLEAELKGLAGKFKEAGLIKEVRGMGFMWGIALGEGISALKLRSELVDKGLLTMNAGEGALRLLPPVTISREQIKEAIQILDTRFSGMAKAAN